MSLYTDFIQYRKQFPELKEHYDGGCFFEPEAPSGFDPTDVHRDDPSENTGHTSRDRHRVSHYDHELDDLEDRLEENENKAERNRYEVALRFYNSPMCRTQRESFPQRVQTLLRQKQEEQAVLEAERLQYARNRGYVKVDVNTPQNRMMRLVTFGGSFIHSNRRSIWKIGPGSGDQVKVDKDWEKWEQVKLPLEYFLLYYLGIDQELKGDAYLGPKDYDEAHIFTMPCIPGETYEFYRYYAIFRKNGADIEEVRQKKEKAFTMACGETKYIYLDDRASSKSASELKF